MSETCGPAGAWSERVILAGWAQGQQRLQRLNRGRVRSVDWQTGITEVTGCRLQDTGVSRKSPGRPK